MQPVVYDASLILQGGLILCAGMGLVLTFLFLLIGVMKLQALVVPRFNHLMPEEAPAKKPVKKAADDLSAVALAIAAALRR